MPATFPRNDRAGNGSAARCHDDAGKSLLHISAQGFVERKFGQFGPTCRSVCMPLGSRRTILQPAASGSRVASQFTGDCRGGPTEAAPDLLHGVALHLEKCDLLALGQRQVPPGERLCRRSEHCWWHAARLSEQSGIRQAAILRLQAQLLHCSAPRQSPAKICSVHHAPPPAAAPAMAMALVQIVPISVLQYSSQPPMCECCDDRLNPPNMPHARIAMRYRRRHHRIHEPQGRLL